jgi:signal transduction histidine kinase
MSSADYNIQVARWQAVFFELLIAPMNFFNTFRGRLLLILAVLLVATIGFQYYLNLQTQADNNARREAQFRSLIAGMNLGFRSLTLRDIYVEDLFNETDQGYFDQETKDGIRDILVIDSTWQVTDSLSPNYQPTYDEKGAVVYKKLGDLTDLPPLMEGARLGDDLKNFPNRKSETNKFEPDEAYAIPIDTSLGRYYVMVLLKNNKNDAAWRAAQPLVFTLGILLVSSLITLLLVWRFTRPIANLSDAARQVAEGNLSVRVPDTNRSDEIGQLSVNFNDMAAELEKSRELEEQLRQAEKSAVVGRLGSAIAHEIRNPLNYINLTLDHLRAKYSPDEPERAEKFAKLTSQLKAEVARINQQISDFLNYSRPAKANLRPIDAREAIADSLRIAEIEAEDKNVKIGVIEHENVPQILGDPEFLRSVFNNLFINAIQSMEKDGGHLTIKILPDQSGEFVNFEIADTGNGIPPENLSKIFEPYFSTKETGTGLGLAIVQKIIDIHGGRIEVQSTEGTGTKFIVQLRRTEGSATNPTNDTN